MKRWEWAAWGGILALGAGLRLGGLGSEALWQDEAWSWTLIRGSVGDLFHGLARHDAHPPLYFVLLQAWSWIFGTSEIALRLPSALLGIAALPLLHHLGRRATDGPGALIAMGLLALSPAHVYFSQEARSYALLFLLCLAALAVFLAVPRDQPRPSSRHAVALGLLAAAILYTHYMGVFFLLSLAAFAAVHRRDRPGAWRALLPAGLLATGLFLPWLPVFLSQFLGRAGATWIRFPGVDAFVFEMGRIVTRGYQFGTATDRWSLPFYATALAIPFVTRRRDHVALLVLLATPVLAELAASVARPVFYGRTFLYILTPLFLLAAVAIRRLPTLPGAAALALLVAAFLPGLVQVHGLDEKEDWRDVHAILAGAAYREKVVVHPGYLDASIRHGARDLPPGDWRRRVILVDHDTIEKPAWPMEDARAVAARAPGVWLVTRYGQDDGWIAFLEENGFTRRAATRRGYVDVTYFTR